MYENIKDLINESKYNEAKTLIVEELKNNDNPDLWYLLFLSENNNYLDFDPNNINNTYAYNQATRSENEEFELEFKLYKELSLMNLNKVFRLIQIGKYDEVDELLKNKSSINFRLSKMITAYLNEILAVEDIDKLNYNLKFIDYVYVHSNNNDNVLNIKDKLIGYINQKKIDLNESSIIENDNVVQETIEKTNKPEIEIKNENFEIENGVLKKYLGKESVVLIPSSVTSIGKSAFYGHSSLTSITIPSSVTSIEDYAFWKCINLTSITIPSSVTSIGKTAFSDCSSLTSITIPSSVTSISLCAFCECDNLTNVYYDGKIEDWCSIIFNGHYSNPMYYAKKFYILDENGKIENSGKKYTLINEIIIPNKVTRIGSCQFIGFRNITSITIPSSVTSIGDGAFSDCRSLTSITIPSSVTSIGGAVFSRCSSLTSITIPSSVTSIENDAFYWCRSLTSIAIPSSVTSIGMFAFSYCRSLTSITIPSSVTSIENYVFYHCSNLKKIHCYKNNIKIIKKALSFFQRLKIKTKIIE